MQLALYLTRGTPEEDSIATSPFTAGGWEDLLAILGGTAWYMIAFCTPLAFFLALAGSVPLIRRRRSQLSALYTWVLTIGTMLCVGIFAVGLTPYGHMLWVWWLD